MSRRYLTSTVGAGASFAGGAAFFFFKAGLGIVVAGACSDAATIAASAGARALGVMLAWRFRFLPCHCAFFFAFPLIMHLIDKTPLIAWQPTSRITVDVAG